MTLSILSRRRFCILGIPIDAVNMEEAVEAIDRAVANRQRLLISTPNLNFLTVARGDPEFRESLFASDLCIADGAPIIWLARLLRLPVAGRVAGSDLYEAVRKRQPPPGTGRIKVFFLGGPEGAAKAACANLNRSPAGLAGAGYIYPGFGSVDDMSGETTIDAINSSGADLLVVAVGALKGQEWLMKNRFKLRVPVMTYLGAVVNFEAGSVIRAPHILRRLGLEWLWRIKEEPKLAARYWADLSTLVRLVAHSAFSPLKRKSLLADDDFMINVKSGESCIVSLSGRASFKSVEKLENGFEAALASCKQVMLDCKDLVSIDHAALGKIALLRKVLNDSGGALSATGVNADVSRFIAMNGLGRLLASSG